MNVLCKTLLVAGLVFSSAIASGSNFDYIVSSGSGNATGHFFPDTFTIFGGPSVDPNSGFTDSFRQYFDLAESTTVHLSGHLSITDEGSFAEFFVLQGSTILFGQLLDSDQPQTLDFDQTLLLHGTYDVIGSAYLGSSFRATLTVPEPPAIVLAVICVLFIVAGAALPRRTA